MVLVLIIIFILVFLLEKIINKLLGIDKTKKISETSGRSVDRWGRGIILVILLCLIPFFITKEGSIMKWYFILQLISSLGFQSILEWKYLKNSKQYVSTVIILILGVVCIYHIENIIKLLN